MRYVGWSVVLLVLACVLYMTCRKSPPLREQLAALDPGERQALESLLRDAGVSPEQLQSVSRFGLDRTPQGVVLDGKHVTGLRLADTALTRTDAIAGLPALVTLALPGGKLAALAGLDKLPELREANLDRNALTALSGLPAAPLRRLSAVGNKLESLRGIEALRGLEQLDVSENPLRDLAALRGHPALKELTAHKCGLTALTGVTELPQLELLRIEDNKLTSLAGLSAVPALRRVWAARNQLTDVSALTGVPKLERADLSGNPLAAYPDTPLETELVVDGTPLAAPPNRVEELPKSAYYNQRYDQSHEGNNTFYEWKGLYPAVDGTYRVELMPHTIKRYVDFELRVGAGRARAYLTNPRGGGYLWVEATPGKPGRIKALLVDARDKMYFVLESRDGAARDVSYVLSRKEGSAF